MKTDYPITEAILQRETNSPLVEMEKSPPPMGVALPDLGLAGTKIKTLRKQQGLSANALSRRSGVARATVLNIESGRSITPRADVLLALARVLGVTVEWLAGDELPVTHEDDDRTNQ